MDRIRNQFSMGTVVTAPLVRNTRSRFATVCCEQPRNKAFRRLAIARLLHKHIDAFTIVIDGAPQIMRFPVDLDTDFIKLERIAKSKVTSPQAPGVARAKFVAPKPDCLITDDHTSLR
jgi:hypothetical protein